MLIKNSKHFLQFLSLLFLVAATSVGVALASGKNAVFVSPKADTLSKLGESCKKYPCASGLHEVWTNGSCVCAGLIDETCRGEPNGTTGQGCSKNSIYKCLYGSKVIIQDCDTVGSGGYMCDVKNGIFFCRNLTPGSKPTPTKPPKLESGCGSANSGACSSGTCKAGSKCSKSGSSCSCIKIKK